MRNSNPSVMGHSFAQVPTAEIPRSVFDRPAGHGTMFNSGYLIPHYWDEVLPGDTFAVQANYVLRMPSALQVPVMDNMFFDTFWFFVPLRLVWTNFVKFMGEQANPGDSTSYTVPVFTAYNPTAEDLSDYLGVPPLGGGATVSHASLLWRAYNLVWNQWFRDENLQNSVTVDLGDGPDTKSNYVLKKRGKRHDYFTSCLPWTQKGTAVTAGLSGSANVLGIGKYNQTFDDSNVSVYETGGTNPTYVYSRIVRDVANGWYYIKGTAATGGYPSITADLSTATGLSINALRLAFQTQRMMERDARGGTRYIEMVKAHFGVTSPDARLQRAEFLGGRSVPILVTNVPQTSPTSGSNAQGDLAAFAHCSSFDGFTKSFTEHGFVIGICNVRCDLTYQQGLPREFSRSTRLDYFWPALQNLGEQAVLNKEIYLQGSASPSNDAATFGYQERYAEYRYKPSRISGKLRSTYATPLDMWHLAEKFTSLPTLSDAFISAPVSTNDPIQRIIAVTSEPQFVMNSWVLNRSTRPMGMFGVPGNIDRF